MNYDQLVGCMLINLTITTESPQSLMIPAQIYREPKREEKVRNLEARKCLITVKPGMIG